MKFYLALRVNKPDDLRSFLQSQGFSIIRSSIELRDPALKNLNEGLYDRGVERRIDSHELRWFEVEGDGDCETIKVWPLCEVVLAAGWFDVHKQNIRHCNGVAYWDATHGLAKDIDLKPQGRAMLYRLESVLKTADLQVSIPELPKIKEATPRPTAKTSSPKPSKRKPSEASATLPKHPIPVQVTLLDDVPVAPKKVRRRGRKVKEVQLDLFG